MLSLYHHTHTFLFLIVRHHPTSTLFPYTTLFRSLHHRHPPRLLAPAPHPPSLRLRRVCPRRGPSHLRVDCLLSRRPHQADQPPPRTETHRRTVAAQLSPNQSHFGAHL